MKNIFIAFFLLVTNIYAFTVEEIIEISLLKNQNLEMIKKKISIEEQNIEISGIYSNPDVFLNKNTLDPKQAMSTTTFGFKQKIEGYGQIRDRKSIAKETKNISELNYKEAKLELVYRIKSISYDVWNLKENLKIIDDFINISNKSNKILSSYSSVKDSHVGIINTELNLYDLKIQKINLNKILKNKLLRLSYLSNTDIDKLDVNLSIKDLSFRDSKEFYENVSLSIIKKEINRQEKIINHSNSNLIPDVNLITSYVVRENYDNFFNFGVSMKLPVYGTETRIIERERIKKLSLNNKLNDKVLMIKSKYNELFNDLESSYNIYNVLNNKSFKSLNHLLSNTQISISSGEDLFKYIEVLKTELKLKKQKIKAIYDFNKIQAKISLIIGKE